MMVAAEERCMNYNRGSIRCLRWDRNANCLFYLQQAEILNTHTAVLTSIHETTNRAQYSSFRFASIWRLIWKKKTRCFYIFSFHSEVFPWWPISAWIWGGLNSTLCNSCPSGVFKGSALISCGEIKGKWLPKAHRIIFVFQKETGDHKEYFRSDRAGSITGGLIRRSVGHPWARVTVAPVPTGVSFSAH